MAKVPIKLEIESNAETGELRCTTTAPGLLIDWTKTTPGIALKAVRTFLYAQIDLGRKVDVPGVDAHLKKCERIMALIDEAIKTMGDEFSPTTRLDLEED